MAISVRSRKLLRHACFLTFRHVIETLPCDWRRKLSYPPLGMLCALLFALSPALSQQFTPYEEIQRKGRIFEPRPSFDTTPVVVRVAKVLYRIPRNYFSLLEPAVPTLKLAWPGLQPLTPETQRCFGSIAQSERAGCTSFSFLLLGSTGPGPDGRALTNSEKFDNFRRNFPNVTSRPGPFGYDIFSIGPEEARQEFHRKADGDIYFKCSLPLPSSRGRGGGCDDMFRLDDMNHLQFFFGRNQIKDIAEIEGEMRNIMSSFVVGRD